MKNLFVLSSPVYSQLSKNLHRLGRWIHACFTLKYIYKSQDIITTYEISLEHIYLDRFFSSTSFWQDFNYLWHNEKILYDINQGSNLHRLYNSLLIDKLSLPLVTTLVNVRSNKLYLNWIIQLIISSWKLHLWYILVK